jgi:hypothetical protein
MINTDPTMPTTKPTVDSVVEAILHRTLRVLGRVSRQQGPSYDGPAFLIARELYGADRINMRSWPSIYGGYDWGGDGSFDNLAYYSQRGYAAPVAARDLRTEYQGLPAVSRETVEAAEADTPIVQRRTCECAECGEEDYPDCQGDCDTCENHRCTQCHGEDYRCDDHECDDCYDGHTTCSDCGYCGDCDSHQGDKDESAVCPNCSYCRECDHDCDNY